MSLFTVDVMVGSEEDEYDSVTSFVEAHTMGEAIAVALQHHKCDPYKVLSAELVAQEVLKVSKLKGQ